MSFLPKWFCCLALALTVLALGQLETVSSLKCYECGGATCDNATGIPSPEATCTGDVCYTIAQGNFSTYTIVYQSCNDHAYFATHLQEEVGICRGLFADDVTQADIAANAQGRPYNFTGSAANAVIVCSCQENDLCNAGFGENNSTYGSPTPTTPKPKKDGGGNSNSPSNFVSANVIGVTVIAVAINPLPAWRLFGF